MTDKSLTNRDYLNIAWKRNMLYHTDKQYEELLKRGCSTLLSEKRTPEKTIDTAFDTLNRECLELYSESLEDLVNNYVVASEKKTNAEFWKCGKGKTNDKFWKCREGNLFDERQMKKYCRWMFRTMCEPNVKLPLDSIAKDNFQEMQQKFEKVDFFFLMLLVWKVIPPYESKEKKKSKENSIRQQRLEVKKRLQNMRELIENLRDDSGVEMGITEKPLVFQDVIRELNEGLNLIETNKWDKNDVRFTTLWFREQLWIIQNACKNLCSPYEQNQDFVSFHKYTMPGIWVDDTDSEARRSFWIFPENKYMAFRYSKKTADNTLDWQLDVFEMAFYASEYNLEEISELCMFVTTAGNQQMIENGENYISEDQMVRVKYAVDANKNGDVLERIEFFPTNPVPEFMKWRKFERLMNSSLEEELKGLLKKFDKECCPKTLTNKSSILTDIKNCLIGVDLEYLYVSDWNDTYSEEGAPQFFLEEEITKDGYVLFLCQPKHYSGANLFAVEISSEYPLYCIPRYEDTDSADLEFKVFKEIVAITRMGDQVTIYNHNKICFNRQSRLFDIDTIMKDYGVRKFTSRDDLIKELSKK